MNDVAEYSMACAEAKESFDDLVARATKDKERVILTRRGKRVDRLDAEEYQRAKAELERSGQPAIPWDEVKAELGLEARGGAVQAGSGAIERARGGLPARVDACRPA